MLMEQLISAFLEDPNDEAYDTAKQVIEDPDRTPREKFIHMAGHVGGIARLEYRAILDALSDEFLAEWLEALAGATREMRPASFHYTMDGSWSPTGSKEDFNERSTLKVHDEGRHRDISVTTPGIILTDLAVLMPGRLTRETPADWLDVAERVL
jgi:hypothetical protein